MRDFSDEFEYRTSHSSGPGGQHVNKTESRVEARFAIESSKLLTELEKNRLIKRLNSAKINPILIVTSQEARSQLSNKEKCNEKLNLMIARMLHVPKKRLATKPTRQSKLNRADSKRIQAIKKQSRRRPEI